MNLDKEWRDLVEGLGVSVDEGLVKKTQPIGLHIIFRRSQHTKYSDPEAFSRMKVEFSLHDDGIATDLVQDGKHQPNASQFVEQLCIRGSYPGVNYPKSLWDFTAIRFKGEITPFKQLRRTFPSLRTTRKRKRTELPDEKDGNTSSEDTETTIVPSTPEQICSRRCDFVRNTIASCRSQLEKHLVELDEQHERDLRKAEAIYLEEKQRLIESLRDRKESVTFQMKQKIEGYQRVLDLAQMLSQDELDELGGILSPTVVRECL
jgi:hypothetical protein